MSGRLTLGVVANEIFSADVGRMGGFGWAVRQVAHLFAAEPGLGVDVVLMVAERHAVPERLPARVHDAPVLWPTSLWSDVREGRRVRPDLLLSIDYRSGYRRWLYALPRVPLLVWVRDPWATRDRKKDSKIWLRPPPKCTNDNLIARSRCGSPASWPIRLIVPSCSRPSHRSG